MTIPKCAYVYGLIYLLGSVGPAIAATVNEDGEIAKAVLALNEGEITAGKIELSKGKNSVAKDFAKMMVTAHQANEKETRAMSQKLGLKPKDSELSKSLRSDGQAAATKLQEAASEALDRSYIEQQISAHKDALKLLDDTLIPSAKDQTLRAFLERTRLAVKSHLDHAESLSTKL